MTHTREEIRLHVHDRAGIHFNELVRESGLAPGQIQYHLRRLARGGDVVRREFYGRTHYFPPTFEKWDHGAIALFRRETAREIVCHLLREGTTTPAALTEELGVARSTVEHHLDHLVEQAVVEKRYDDRGRVVLTLTRPDRTLELLSTVQPQLADRLVDRFTRLVDDVFEDDPAF